MILTLLYILLCFLAGMLWRMGGAEGYDKLWRRIGSALCMLVSIILIRGLFTFLNIASAVLLIWGCVSYMGWLNSIVKLWWKQIEMKKEYIWNFAFENLVIQSTVLLYKRSIWSCIFMVGSAMIIAFIKIWVDDDSDGKILCWRKDVLSEFLHGCLNCIAIIINLLFI